MTVDNSDLEPSSKPNAQSSSNAYTIRACTTGDGDQIWDIIEPTFRAGETYPVSQDISKVDGLAYWFAPGHSVYAAEENGKLLGTYFLKANFYGGGSHVANCGYIIGPWAQGRGVAKALCQHSLQEAKAKGFRSMQFNFVISTNERAVKLWQSQGFKILARVPQGFLHPVHGYVDTLIMFQSLV